MKITDNTFEKRAIKAMAKGAYLDESELNLDLKFVDLGLESVDFLEIIFEMEEEFGVQIPIDGYTNLEEMNGHRLISELKKIVEASHQETNQTTVNGTLDVS